MPDANIAALGLFQDEEHQPFFWEAGRPAVLLTHGFMGTPAEMRPLGQAFEQAGWTAQGLLLPGFGPQLDSLFDRNDQDWIDAVVTALADLQTKHHPVVLAGYSMGAAVALSAAAKKPPDGLVLVAPFWRIGTPAQRLIWQFLKRIFRRPRPFSRASFDDPRLRDFLGGLLPELNLNDPATQSTLRQLRVPSSFAEQIFSVGKAAGNAAPHVSTPTLIVQGLNDEAVRPAPTRQLLQRFRGPLQYLEVVADHDLVQPDKPGYAQLRDSALHFASTLEHGPA